MRNVVTLVAAAAALALMGYIVHDSMRVRSGVPGARANLKAIRRIPLGEVTGITVVYRSPRPAPMLYKSVDLDARADRHDVEMLLDSMKRIRVDGRDRSCAFSGTIKIRWGNGRSCTLHGCFDPARSPVITKNMRSEDLSQIIHDIFRRKGIEPRKQQ